MPRELLRRLTFRCLHQFSWPRQSPEGDCYQVCLRCGVSYAYDWSTMRRAAPLEERPGKRAASTAARRHGWRPRERRLKLDIPVEFRLEGALEWLQGRSLNVSRSGLLLRVEKPLELGENVEFVLDMPVEIAGYNGNRVQCQGTVVRAVEAEGSPAWSVALSISKYEFLSENAVGF